jgi:hypothetical protein
VVARAGSQQVAVKRAGPSRRQSLVGRRSRFIAASLAAFAVGLALGGCASSHPGFVVDPAPSADATVTDAADASADAPARMDAADAPAASTLRVLFIGNSYTFVNDLPGTLHALALAAGSDPAIEVSSVTVGGYTLQQHWDGPDARPAIARGGLTHVVLQDQSVEPASDPTAFAASARLFTDAIAAAHATPVLYETWARKAGDAIYASPWAGDTPDKMQDLLLAAYGAAVTEGSAELAPVGEAFRETWTLHPGIDLYQSDGSHPTPAGTYLAACVFYDVLAGHAFVATGAVPAGVSAADASVLRGVAAHAVATH